MIAVVLGLAGPLRADPAGDARPLKATALAASATVVGSASYVVGVGVDNTALQVGAVPLIVVGPSLGRLACAPGWSWHQTIRAAAIGGFVLASVLTNECEPPKDCLAENGTQFVVALGSLVVHTVVSVAEVISTPGAVRRRNRAGVTPTVSVGGGVSVGVAGSF